MQSKSRTLTRAQLIAYIMDSARIYEGSNTALRTLVAMHITKLACQSTRAHHGWGRIPPWAQQLRTDERSIATDSRNNYIPYKLYRFLIAPTNRCPRLAFTSISPLALTAISTCPPLPRYPAKEKHQTITELTSWHRYVQQQ